MSSGNARRTPVSRRRPRAQEPRRHDGDVWISPVSRRRPRALGSLDRKIGERLPHLHRQGLADLKHAGDDADRDQRDHQKCADQRAGRHQVGQ